MSLFNTHNGSARTVHLFQYLLLGFLFLMAVSLLGRILFVCLVSYEFVDMAFTEVVYALLWGLRFDFAAAAILTTFIAVFQCLLIVVRRFSRLSSNPFVIAAVLILMLQTGDLMYFRDAGRHVTYEILDVIEEFWGLFNTLFTSYLPYAIGAIIASVFLIFLCRNRRVRVQTGAVSLTVSMLLWILVAVFSIRGGIREDPMSPSRVYAIGDERQALIAHNAAYAVIYYVYRAKKADAVYKDMPNRDGVKARYQASLEARAKTVYVSPRKRANVILVALEGWPAFHMGGFNAEAGPVTPRFDEFREQGITTDGLIASGHRTVEGLFGMVCSFPNPLGLTVIKNHLYSFDYQCLPELLKQEGWSTAIFQGMGRGKTGDLMQKLGVEASYGKKDIKKITKPPNGWGVDDHDLYQFVLDTIAEETRPFFYVINTATTHDVVLPPGEPYRFGEANESELRRSVIHYADRALGHFIDGLKAHVSEPTLVILTSDHTTGALPSRFTHYHLPFAMIAINEPLEPIHLPGLASQRDIAPTIVQWLGGHVPWFTGGSLLDASYQSSLAADYFIFGTVGWVEGERLVEFSIRKPDQLTCYSWRDNWLMENSRDCDEEDVRMAQKAAGFIQYTQELIFEGKTAFYGQ